jgi:short subunit dehydrogenase-like uncharacterized protein
MKSRILLYGVDNFAGALASRAAMRRGLSHIAAGRNIAGVAQHATAIAKEAGSAMAEPRTFTLGDRKRVAAQLDDVAVVVNCGPLGSEGLLALVDACLATGTHFIDMTNDRAEVAALAAHDEVARRAKTMVMAGAGFDYAAVDAVAERLAQILRGARAVTIAVKQGAPTLAEARRLVAALKAKGETVKNGQFVPARAGERAIEIDFGAGPERAWLAPWRAEATAMRHRGTYSTIESYEVLPERAARVFAKGKLATALFNRGWGVRRLEHRLSKGRLSPTALELANGRAVVWGEARTPEGIRLCARLETPEAHLWSAEAAVLLARCAVEGRAKPGFQLPFAIAGASLIEEIPGTFWREIADPADPIEPEPVPVVLAALARESA